MFYYWGLVPIEQVEARAKAEMDGFDELPRERRDAINGDHRLHSNRGSGA
jgi:hypothetical protein